MDDSAKLILVVEDEHKIARLICDYLHSIGGYRSHHLDHGDSVVQWVRNNSPDLVVLDWMLPGTDGIELCKQIRSFSQVPIIMLTARVEEIDRLLGLELGADDYICKPFSPREVVARVKAQLRRSEMHLKPPENHQLVIDPVKFQAGIRGEILKLTPVEFNLLRCLADNPGRVFSREQLMNDIYSDYRVVSDRTVDTHIKNLRKKLADAADGNDFIESVYGVGYRFTY